MILTDARAGLARSGATRSGYPVLEGVKVPLYAISNIARSGATRSNYTGSHVFIEIGGVPIPPHTVLYAGANIVDTLDETPTTGSFSTHNFHPVEGQEVIVRVGSANNSRRLFAGTILAVTRGYAGKPANAIDDCRLIDYTWGLGQRQVRTRYLSTSVAAIVADLVATYAPGYGWRVETDIGADVLDEITFTETSLPGCLTQLTRRVGGSWICDYQKVVQVFYENTLATNPRPLNAVHPTLLQFQATRDLSQVVTRALVEGGGVTVFANCAVGETILPLDGDPGWYSPSGGTVVSGPQRVTYTGVSASTGGGMVGPGAAPTGRPTATQAAGSGIESGTHQYAVTFTTASGESIAGPVATIDVGAVPAPLTAPTAGEPQPGLGPEPGTHGYAVTFVTASGETLAGPTVSVATGTQDPPATAPTVGVPTASATGVDAGLHEYAVSFMNANGETTAGPISGAFATAVIDPPPAPGLTAVSGSALSVGTYRYAYSYITPAGQTLVSATTSVTTSPGIRVVQVSMVGKAGQDQRIYRTLVNGTQLYQLTTAPPMTAFISDTTPDSSLATTPDRLPPTVNTAGAISSMPVQDIPKGPTGTTGRKLYRRSGGVAFLKIVNVIPNNSSTTYTDTTPNASLGSSPPVTNSATTRVIPLSAIPLGGSALVTSRKVYRTAAGAAQLKLLTTLADNTTTTFTDTVVDASLGANVPTSTTATANQVALSAIPIGAASVTSRKLYRTAANASQLKLLTTIANNTATTHTDAASLAALGANVPVSDTSGLTQPSGSVNPGSTTIQIANIGPFPAAGWAVIGNGQQVIRYTGVSGNTLTGIPASGAGAIVAAISYNSTVTAAAVLTGIPASGIGSIRFPVLKGDDVNLFVVVNDVAAQAALAAMIGGDGVQEHYLQDRRLSLRECTARGQALLELKRDVGVEISFQTHDLNTRAGSTVSVNLGAPFFLIGDFVVQQVTIDFIPTRPPMPPRFTATASSYRLSFEDLLRAIKAKD